MKNLKCTLLMTLMLVFSMGVFAQQEKLSKIRVLEKEDARKLKAIEILQLDHVMFGEGGYINTTAPVSLIKNLKAAGIKYEVLIDDVVKRLIEEDKKILAKEKAGETSKVAFEQEGRRIDQIIQTPAAWSLPASFGGYLSFAEMRTRMGTLRSTYPGIVDTFGIGFTHQGNRIIVVKISDNVNLDENEPEVLFMGLQHAREAISGSSMIFLMQYLADRYTAGDPKIVNLIQNREIYIIPCFNVDGWEYNRTSMSGNPGGDWRKNRRNNGTDLNRNWGTDWGDCPSMPSNCGSNVSTHDTYIGTSAFSEPETRVVRDWVYTRQFTAMIDQHSFGPYYSLPFGRPSLHSMSADDAEFYRRVPALMGTYNGMRAGNSPQAVNYEVAGGVKDWMLMGNIGTGTKGKIYGMTGEGGAAGGSSSNFWPRRDSITRLCKGMTYQNLQLALAAGSYVDIQDQGNLNVNARFGTFNVSLRRIGLGDQPITLSLVPLENVVSTGAPVVINSIPNYYDTVIRGISYALPWTIQVGNGQRLKYIWRVQTGGITYDDTITKFYNPVQLVYDDMENTGAFATNWTTSSVGTATVWDYSTRGGAYQGSRTLQESPTNLYGFGDSMLCTRTTQLNLSDATQAYLSFWTMYAAENGRDKLQLQISLNNGGAWQTAHARGSHTIQEHNDGDGSKMWNNPALTGIRDVWTKVTYDLTPYVGPGRTQVRFRLVFVSDPDETLFAFDVDEGFSIDNLQVIKSTVPMSILPVRFLDVRGKLLPNRTVEVSWEAETDAEHSYFEVEKSSDGTNFQPIGKVHSIGNPYKFIDNTPYAGNNYYRIKQYDKNGNFNFSQTVKVANVYSSGLTVYPNPLVDTDILTLRPDGNFNQPLNIRIADATGRVVYHKFIHEWPSNNEIKVNTAAWPAQVYVLKVTNSRGEFVAVEKIIKK